jgi:hypothetical protein
MEGQQQTSEQCFDRNTESEGGFRKGVAGGNCGDPFAGLLRFDVSYRAMRRIHSPGKFMAVQAETAAPSPKKLCEV